MQMKLSETIKSLKHTASGLWRPFRPRRKGQAMTEVVLLFPIFMIIVFITAKMFALMVLVLDRHWLAAGILYVIFLPFVFIAFTQDEIGLWLTATIQFVRQTRRGSHRASKSPGAGRPGAPGIFFPEVPSPG